ncbi:MAG: DUF448 domain-containing protein [Trueperaceae bacterium]|nr:DUF448 domain-containing protein [Trueperaceae bacterium]
MTRTRHVPLRRCVACRESRPKRELIRLVRTAAAGDGGWALDLRQRAGGRGTSLCPACALAAVRRDDAARLKGFRRAFRQDADAVASLLAELEATLVAATASAAEPVTADNATLAAASAVTSAAAAAEPPRPNGGMHG